VVAWSVVHSSEIEINIILGKELFGVLTPQGSSFLIGIEKAHLSKLILMVNEQKKEQNNGVTVDVGSKWYFRI
jgi:hypothetical protein